MSFDRPPTPPRSATGWGDDGYGRDSYGASGPGYSGDRRSDDIPPPVALDDPYGIPRRPRSPDDDRRKRRRSPSPGGRAGTDTYIPAYQRERSPPYRDSRRDSYYGGGQGGDRYDGRGGYGRDGYDGAAGMSDRRHANLPRSQMRPPQELPYLATFSYFRDWIRDEDHRTYDDRAKLEDAYKKYRSGFLLKTNQGLWNEIKGMSWCKEKYGISEEQITARKSIREKGREGKLDAFLSALESGDLEDFSLDQKAPVTPASPAKKDDAKLEGSADVKAEKLDDATSPQEGEEAKPEGESPMKTEEQENGLKAEESTGDDAMQASGGDEETKPLTDNAEQPDVEKKEEDPEDKKEDDVQGEEQETKKNDEDSVLIPQAPNTLFIKSLSPEISRSDLEAHCRQVEGFDYVAFGEPNLTKRFHRTGFIVFKPEANMTEAAEKLCESQINGFTLHMHVMDKPTYQRMRVAPKEMGTPERINSSLGQTRQIVANYEAELDGDNRGSQAIEKKVSEAREKMLADLAEGDEDARKAAEETLERRALDLNIHYLRSVFHTCFYCVAAFDFAEELTKKCVKHVRRHPQARESRKFDAEGWLKNFDEKIQLLVNRDGVDPVEFGGESYQDELTNQCKPHIQVEDEGKFRCKNCRKLFKAAPFVEKHILNKHPEVIGDRLEELKYFNNFVLDPGHVSPPINETPQLASSMAYNPSGAFYNGMASTFGAFNQMFNPQFGGYGMMGGYGAGFPGYGNMFQPMGGFNGGFGGYGQGPLTGDARSLGNRIGDRSGGYGGMGAEPMRMNGGPNKRARRESNLAPPPPPKGARIDPRAGRVQAYTDLDGPPAGGGDDMLLDY